MSLSFESLKLDKNVEIEECRCYHKESDIEGIRGKFYKSNRTPG